MYVRYPDKGNFPAKNWNAEKATSYKIQGMSKVSKVHGACKLARNRLPQCWRCQKKFKKYSNKYIRLHLRSLFVMLKVLYTYINRMKPLPQYVHTESTAVASSLYNLK